MKKIINSLLAIIMVLCGMGCTSQTVSGNKDGHDYVDLGLPSGRLWATCNVGASKPTEYGDYFAWGETSPKKKYDIATYKWIDDDESFTKYRANGLKTLIPSDDAVTQNWGKGWRMPTYEEQLELLNGCIWTKTTNYQGSGIAGRVGKSKKNGNIIFLPAAGIAYGIKLSAVNIDGFYWSSTLYENYQPHANNLYIYYDYIGGGDSWRYQGQTVRAVVK